MKTNSLVLVSMFTALHVLAAIIVRFGGDAVVPFSLVPLMVILSGLLLGAKLGALSLVTYATLGLVGIPVFASAPYAGPTYVLKPTFGFVVGYILAAYVTGLIYDVSTKDSLLRAVGASIVGLVCLYAVGLTYFYFAFTHFYGVDMTVSRTFALAFTPFIGFDAIKLIIASLIAVEVKRRLPKRA